MSDRFLSKAELRREAKRRLNALTTEEKAQKTRDIERFALTLPEYAAAESVFMYVAMQNEVGTQGIIRDALKRGKRVFVPVCCGEKMFAQEIRALDVLSPGQFGIPAPEYDEKLALGLGCSEITFLPGLAFDGRFARLGRGRGYYDRFFAGEYRGFKVGLAFGVQVFREIPCDAWDVRVDALITEAGVIRRE